MIHFNYSPVTKGYSHAQSTTLFPSKANSFPSSIQQVVKPTYSVYSISSATVYSHCFTSSIFSKDAMNYLQIRKSTSSTSSLINYCFTSSLRLAVQTVVEQLLFCVHYWFNMTSVQASSSSILSLGLFFALASPI